jgi:hypothetical protein
MEVTLLCPDQVQEAYAREAEENQHTHQDSRRGNDQIPVLFIPLYIETSNRQLAVYRR